MITLGVFSQLAIYILVDQLKLGNIYQISITTQLYRYTEFCMILCTCTIVG